MLRPRNCIAALEPYRSPVGERTGLNLDLNENASGCSERVLARLRTMTAREVSLYPDRTAGERVVADFLRVPPEQVLLTNGIDEGLYLLSASYLSEGDEMLLADPTFSMYAIYGNSTGARVNRVMMGDDFVFPTNEVLAQVSNRTRLITIANPNNPTGATVASDELLRILKFASNSIVLVDEAYFEFGGETLLSEVDHYPNLIIARTFSKAYGLAGLRLGSLIGQPEQIAYLRRFCSPFNVNAVALACLEEALPDQRFVSGYVAQVEQGRERLAKLCAELGLRWWPSRANFLSFRIGQSCRSFVEAMAQRGIQVRDLSAMPGCGGCVRITVGTTAQMEVVLQAMRGVLTELRR